MPKSMSCVHIATARSRGHLPFNSSSFSFLFVLNSCRRLKSSKTNEGIRCNFGIANAKAARSISRDGEFELAMSSDSSSDLIIDDSERRPLKRSHAATKSTTLDVFVPPIVSFIILSSFSSKLFSSLKRGEEDDDATRTSCRRLRFFVASE